MAASTDMFVTFCYFSLLAVAGRIKPSFIATFAFIAT
jgi:hypothetical protein